MSCKRMIRTVLRECLYDASQDSAKRYHGLRSQTVPRLKSVPAPSGCVILGKIHKCSDLGSPPENKIMPSWQLESYEN